MAASGSTQKPSPDETISLLQAGNQRFVSGQSQHPHTDAGVMDLFVIRVAGNVCDTDEIGSIEYGLAHVNTPVLVSQTVRCRHRCHARRPRQGPRARAEHPTPGEQHPTRGRAHSR